MNVNVIYPIGSTLPAYPSTQGTYPATVTGYVTHVNLSSGQTTVCVQVRVLGKTETGEGVPFYEDFDPALFDE